MTSREPTLTRVLGIDVDAALLACWAGWLAPAAQPFRVDADLARLVADHVEPRPAPALRPVDACRDVFGLYGTDPEPDVVWLDDDAFHALPAPVRTALVRARVADDADLVPSVRAWRARLGAAAADQADGHRFAWWPALLAGHEAPALRAYVEAGRRPSRHGEVSPATWAAAAAVLPGARDVAGRFAPDSGPNCFGVVMAAAGVPGAATTWMQREPFEAFLADRTRPGGRDEDPGTVWVWRSPDGAVQHAAVTLGDGWALHKPSQGWMSPTKVLDLRGCRASARARGRRLTRRTLLV